MLGLDNPILSIEVNVYTLGPDNPILSVEVNNST